MSNNLRQIGKIFKAHGLRGDVKIYSNLDLIQFMNPDDFIYINNDENYIPFKIKELKHFKKNIYLVSFKEIDHIQKIENLINCEIFSNKILVQRKKIIMALRLRILNLEILEKSQTKFKHPTIQFLSLKNRIEKFLYQCMITLFLKLMTKKLRSRLMKIY